MPDANLRRAVSEKLDIETLTIPDMQRLYDLVVIHGDGIRSLEGLQHAQNLGFLHISGAFLSDLTPLAGLKNLHTLKLYGNKITDITPLAKLTQLRVLQLHANNIHDFTPLIGLTHLKKLRTDGNPTVFYNILPICDFPSPTYVRLVKERIDAREYPSIVVEGMEGFKNTTGLEPIKHFALSDASMEFRPFYPLGALRFGQSILGEIVRAGDVEHLREVHEDLLTQNPDMLFIVEIWYFNGRGYAFREDSPYYLRNPDGTIAQRRWSTDTQGNAYWEPLADFSHPDVIDMIVAKAVAVAKCGLYDGIYLDRWHEKYPDLEGLVPFEVEMSARDEILQRIRQAVPDDFLVIVNATWTKIPRWAAHVNGILMETWASPDPGSLGSYGTTYTRKDYRNYEEALLWNEANLREPNLTLLHAKFRDDTDRQSPQSLQTMRTFTTLSLTHSDGSVNVAQVNYGSIWYDFFGADLGHPIGAKGQLYESREGLFIREFTNGWAVYNRSGAPQAVQLPELTTSVESGSKNTLHILPDLDGDIYLKITTDRRDVNKDGIVNILDLVAVANGFGTEAPDVNGDGVVNVLDLVAVANAF